MEISNQRPIDNKAEKQNDPVAIQKQQELLDFSTMFKKGGFVNKPALKLGANRDASKTTAQGPNWLLEIPAKLDITLEDFQQRRYINMDLWQIMVKSTKENQCLVAVLNVINSISRQSTDKLFTLKEVRQIINKKQLNIAEKSRRQSIVCVYEILKEELKLKSCKIQIHEVLVADKNKQLLTKMINSTKNPQKSSILIGHNKVLNLIGFENTPLVPLDAFKKLSQINEQKLQMWLIFSNTQKQQNAPMIIKRWTDVETAMTCRWPDYIDLEETKKGKQIGELDADVRIREVGCWVQFTVQQ